MEAHAAAVTSEMQRRQASLRTNFGRAYAPPTGGLVTQGVPSRRPLPPQSMVAIRTKEAAIDAVACDGLLLRHLHPSLLSGDEESRHAIELEVRYIYIYLHLIRIPSTTNHTMPCRQPRFPPPTDHDAHHRPPYPSLGRARQPVRFRARLSCGTGQRRDRPRGCVAARSAALLRGPDDAGRQGDRQARRRERAGAGVREPAASERPRCCGSRRDEAGTAALAWLAAQILVEGARRRPRLDPRVSRRDARPPHLEGGRSVGVEVGGSSRDGQGTSRASCVCYRAYRQDRPTGHHRQLTPNSATIRPDTILRAHRPVRRRRRQRGRPNWTNWKTCALRRRPRLGKLRRQS